MSRVAAAGRKAVVDAVEAMKVRSEGLCRDDDTQTWDH